MIYTCNLKNLIFIQGPVEPWANTLWANMHIQLGHLQPGHNWVHLKHEVLMFIINKREQIWDQMAVHVDKSTFSYQEICKHYIEAKTDTPIAKGMGDFIITGTRLFLDLLIIIVKPCYVQRKGNKMDTVVHKYKCTVQDKIWTQTNVQYLWCTMVLITTHHVYLLLSGSSIIKRATPKKIWSHW